MRTEDSTMHESSPLSQGKGLVFNQESSLTPRSSRSRSRRSSSSSSSNSSSSSSSISGHSYSSSDRSRSPSVARRSRRRPRHGSRFSSSSSSSSRSRPRCYRASDRSHCRYRHRSRSNGPYRGRSSHYGRRQYSLSVSRSSSRERYYRRSRSSRSRSSSYRRTQGSRFDRVRSRFSPSPERCIRLSHKEKKELLNIAQKNAARILGVDVMKLPASVSCHEEQVTKMLATESQKRVMADPVPLKEPPQNDCEADEDAAVSKVSPPRKPISFSISNTVAKPSQSPTLNVTERKVTSRADSVGNRFPYGRWIPVKKVYSKKR